MRFLLLQVCRQVVPHLLDEPVTLVQLVIVVPPLPVQLDVMLSFDGGPLLIKLLLGQRDLLCHV